MPACRSAHCDPFESRKRSSLPQGPADRYWQDGWGRRRGEWRGWTTYRLMVSQLRAGDETVLEIVLAIGKLSQIRAAARRPRRAQRLGSAGTSGTGRRGSVFRYSGGSRSPRDSQRSNREGPPPVRMSSPRSLEAAPPRPAGHEHVDGMLVSPGFIRHETEDGFDGRGALRRAARQPPEGLHHGLSELGLSGEGHSLATLYPWHLSGPRTGSRPPREWRPRALGASFRTE